jgi:hypothetical protein
VINNHGLPGTRVSEPQRIREPKKLMVFLSNQ